MPSLILVDYCVTSTFSLPFSFSFSAISIISIISIPRMKSNYYHHKDTNHMESQVTDMPIFADLANLSNEKLQQLESTVKFILASPAAQNIYAQLIDGRRTWQSYTDPETRGFCYKATPSSDHPNPSNDAMRLYEEIRTALTLQGLKVDIKADILFSNRILHKC